MLKSIWRKVPRPLKILSIFFLLSMIHLYPILKNFFTKLPYATNGDVSLCLTVLYSNIQKLGHLQFSQIYHLPYLFPLSYTMTLGITLFGQSLLLLPIFLLGIPNVYPVYNAIVLFAYLAAGYGAYLFFKEVVDDEAVSIISAGLYVLLPFRVLNIAHLNLLFNFPIPFCLLFLLRYLKDHRQRDLICFNIFLLSQFLFDPSLGFFLSISLVFFLLIHILITRPLPWRNLLGLVFSLLPTMAIIFLVHVPFLRTEISLSPSEPSFDPRQYIPALSFYAGRSYFLLFLDRIWDAWPLFPGFFVVCFYFYAFSSFVSNLRDKFLLAVMVGSYVIPGGIAVVCFRKQAMARIEALSEIGLIVFFCSLAALVFFSRKRIPPKVMLLSLFFLSLLFVTFQPFPKIFDVFSAAVKIFPFLHRSRVLRVHYILPLAMLGLFSLGLRVFLEKKRNKKFYLWAIILVLLLERFRWPITMARLPEINADAKTAYEMMEPYPDHFGVLELPFLAASSNVYTFMTRYHNKHTYHGDYFDCSDILSFAGESELQVDGALPGLKDPAMIQKLKDNGLNLIVINGPFIPYVYGGDVPAIWRKIRQNALEGRDLGLIKEIHERPTSLLIVLDDARTGSAIEYPIPFFALIGGKSIQCHLRADQAIRCRLYFNDRLIFSRDIPAGEQDLSLDVQTVPKQNQINRLRVVSDHPVTLRDVQIK